MTLTEKFGVLSPEQREKFNTVKDDAGLDSFLSETGVTLSSKEKAQVIAYIVSGKLPLADEELINIAGGGCGGSEGIPNCNICGEKMTTRSRSGSGGYYCGKCNPPDIKLA